jgi:hypothetical protein
VIHVACHTKNVYLRPFVPLVASRPIRKKQRPRWCRSVTGLQIRRPNSSAFPWSGTLGTIVHSIPRPVPRSQDYFRLACGREAIAKLVQPLLLVAADNGGDRSQNQPPTPWKGRSLTDSAPHAKHRPSSHAKNLTRNL